MDESHNTAIRALITNVPIACVTANKLELAVERFVYLCNEYQERRQLLDGNMPDYIDALLGHVNILREEGPIITRQADHAFQLLAFLCKVRHEKVMMNRLPHGVEFLPPVLDVLEQVIERESETPVTIDHVNVTALDDVTSNVSWQTPYVLLLWLTLLVGNPFDLQRFSTDNRSVISRVHRCAIHFAHVKSRAAQVASRLVAQLMARSDTPDALLASTINTSVTAIVECQPTIAQLSTSELAASHLAVLAQVTKRGAMREKLIPFTSSMHSAIMNLPTAQCSTLIRKAVIKLDQRIALTLLPPRACKWRYSRGGRTLLDNVAKTTILTAVVDDVEDDDDDYDVPPLVEEIIGHLLTSMGDNDTIVRWSVAKGIGRVCARLSRQMADDVIVGVLEQMSDPLKDDCGWHSACFALAELARRGCLLPRRLDQIVYVACQALQYALQRGRHALGSNVRDAGAYLCWALARAFTQTDLASHVQTIATQLVVAALADRNVSVRRAAQSAFQELVGRHGRIAHSELIMEKCDYMAVNNTRRCYAELMTVVWPLDEYRSVLLKHILSDKLHHWHADIRQLSAEALANLTKIHPSVGREQLPALFADAVSYDLFKRHGALLAINHISNALLTLNELTDDLRTLVIQLPLQLHDNHSALLTGSGAELTRVAVYDIVFMLLHQHVEVDGDVFTRWHDLLLRDVGDVRASVRTSASRALGEQHAYATPPADHSAVLNTWLPSHIAAVQSDTGTEANRMGHINVIRHAAGVLPPTHPLLPSMHMAIMSIFRVCGKIDERWAEARQTAVNAVDDMNDVAVRRGHVGIPSSPDSLLTLACRDYTRDERGDVGRIVREAAVTAVVKHLMRGDNLKENIAVALPVLITLAVEPLDSVRLKVVDGMRVLLAAPSASTLIPHFETLHSVFIADDDAADERANEADSGAYAKYQTHDVDHGDDVEDEEDGEGVLFVWRRAEDAYDRLAPLLGVDEFLMPALRGYVVAAGGLGESVQRAAIDQLTAHVQDLIDDGDMKKVDTFFTCIAKIADENSTSNDRVYLPLLVTLDTLLSMDALLTVADGRSVDNDVDWLPHIADSVAKTTLKKRSVRKITLGVAVQCAMLQFDPNSQLWMRAMQRVLTALVHVYPGVRRSTADKLYETLLMFGTLDNHNEIVTTMLTQTQWHSDKLDEVRAVRDTIAERLNIPLRSPRVIDKE